MNQELYVFIGKVVNTFGIKGELKITSESDFVDYRYRVGAKIFFKRGQTLKEVTVSSYRLIKGNPTIKINNLNDINQVLDYIGSDVYALKEDTPPLGEGEYMIDEIVGLKVYEDGIYIGIVEDVIIIPSNDILAVRLINGQEKLIPFVDEYIESFDDEKIMMKKIEVMNDEV